MPQSRIGFGLLGTGLIAPFHAKALRASGVAELVAAADMVPERLDRFTAEFGCKGYASLEEMLADSRIQVINVLTPNHLHFDPVMKSIGAGRHVLIEKPPSMSLDELRQMIAASRKAEVKAGVVLQCRTRKSIQAIRKAIAEGRFGKLLHADVYMKWFRPAEYYRMDAWRGQRRSGSGVTIAQTFHYIDLLQYLCGPVKRVQARMNNLAHPGVELEDTLLAFTDFANGAQGVVQASTALWPGTDIRIEVNGENGTAIMSGDCMETWKFRTECPEDEEIRSYGTAGASTGATGAADLGFEEHQVVIEDMVGAIRERRDPFIPLESVLPTLEWALAMYQSARENAPVELPIDESRVW
jgi:UDP-N-acetyl-2-amino-2-deoxyglucuronate dehydrogenase